MEAGIWRRVAFAGGCLAGIGLGVLVSSLNPYMEGIMLGFQDVLWSFSFWLPCLMVGMCLGAAVAAMIPDNRPAIRRHTTE